MSNIPAQFFVPDPKGDSQTVYKTVIAGNETVQDSELRARTSQSNTPNVPTITVDGIPGIPFERGTPNPDTFFQGEDIIYDMFLYYAGSPVSSDDYDVIVNIKASPRAQTTIWQGTLDNGVYPNPSALGHFEVWIPSVATSAFLAGTYYLGVLLQERVGKGKGRYDRKHLLLRSSFNIDYSNFSPTTVSVGHTTPLSTVERVWPNAPNTVGNPNASTDGTGDLPYLQ